LTTHDGILERLHIQNFQSHANSELEFSKGLNVIIGESDQGKSSIIRALRFCLFNRPLGTGFLSHFKKKKETTEVALHFTEGNITRIRGNNRNEYVVDGKKLEALKFDVPEEVGLLSGISDINFQVQGDPHFLLSDTPGVRAKLTNALVGLSVIDVSVGKIKSEILKTTERKKALIASVSKIESSLEQLHEIDVFTSIISGVEMLIKDRDRMGEGRQKIKLLKDTLSPLVDNLDRVSGIIAVKGTFDSIYETVSSVIPGLRAKLLKLKHLSAQLLTLSETARLLTTVSDNGEVVDRIKSNNVEKQTLENKLLKLKHLSAQLLTLSETARLLSTVSDNGEAVDRIKSNNVEKQTLENKLYRLTAAHAVLKNLSHNNEKFGGIMAGTEILTFLETSTRGVRDLRTGLQALKHLRTSYIEKNSQLSAIKETLKQKVTELNSIDICPTCGQRVDTWNAEGLCGY